MLSQLEAMYVIEVTHLTKRYGPHTAVSDLNFRLEPGRIYGLLGPNGAGKSTTMNLMAGCLAPTEGTVTVDGLDLFQTPRQAKGKIGYLPELLPLYPDMTVEEYLRFVGRARGLKAPAERTAAVMDRTSVADVSRRLIRNLSKGYQQRVGIAQALIADPEIVILDEPTVGLDPKQITEIRELIASLRGKCTVVLSSHILSEVQAVCDHVLILNKGRLLASGTPEELERRAAGRPRLILTVRADRDTVERILRDVPGIRKMDYTPGGDGTALVELETDRARNEQVFLAFSRAQCPILQMQESRATLESVFLELTEQTKEVPGHDGDLHP